MWLLISACIGFLIFNLCVATIHIDQENRFYSKPGQLQECKIIGNQCQEDSDCCSDLICYSHQEHNLCLPATFQQYSKRRTDDFIIPPYYNPKNQLYPYGISKPGLPFYKGQELKQTHKSKKMEWEHCQFHEDCGEGNCCYVHFRFRSLPKWFCRPNRTDMSELCEPLTKYRSLKDVPAWKQQQQADKERQQQR